MRVSRRLGALWSRGCLSCLFPLPFFCLRGGIGRHTTLKMWRSVGRVGSSPTGGTGWLFGVGLLIIEDHVPVAELVDAPDSKSGIRWGVWVRVPPGALAARGFLRSPLTPVVHLCYSGSIVNNRAH